ncbi:hypothetical protein AXF42_Ash012954 [Apostasia shenzhenica]|uniref:Uncharacterized protein n=1 Tax=Apostasia shenzhenica TaxID=1088818 RepID=A0A2I0ARQ1_9ASPA|nr:hypothetical protein AXF42_Ash012954 [Apostasia shenzhenica]
MAARHCWRSRWVARPLDREEREKVSSRSGGRPTPRGRAQSSRHPALLPTASRSRATPPTVAQGRAANGSRGERGVSSRSGGRPTMRCRAQSPHQPARPPSASRARATHQIGVRRPPDREEAARHRRRLRWVKRRLRVVARGGAAGSGGEGEERVELVFSENPQISLVIHFSKKKKEIKKIFAHSPTSEAHSARTAFAFVDPPATRKSREGLGPWVRIPKLHPPQLFTPDSIPFNLHPQHSPRLILIHSACLFEFLDLARRFDVITSSGFHTTNDAPASAPAPTTATRVHGSALAAVRAQSAAPRVPSRHPVACKRAASALPATSRTGACDCDCACDCACARACNLACAREPAPCVRISTKPLTWMGSATPIYRILALESLFGSLNSKIGTQFCHKKLQFSGHLVFM